MSQKAESQAELQGGFYYPVIEAFAERASAEDVGHFFASLKEALGDLKGPRAAQAKKVQTAIERTEELLAHLVQVREKLEEDRQAGARGRQAP